MSEGKKEILLGDCLELLKTIESESIDLILTDPPYNTTDCKWDKQPIDWNILKAEFMRIIKPTGTICISVQNPFTFMIGGLFVETYRHRWIWKKNKCANFLVAKSAPMKYTEDILVFSKHGFQNSWNNTKPKSIYNPPFVDANILTTERRKHKFTPRDHSEGIQEINKREKRVLLKPTVSNIPYGKKYPNEIIEFNIDKEILHPTQKPIFLFEQLIKTYTNEGMLVLDCFGGSGTTAIACLNTKRQFIVMEKEQKYYDIILKRVGDFNKNFEPKTLFGNEM